MRVLVCGGRYFAEWPKPKFKSMAVAKEEYDFLWNSLDDLVNTRRIDLDKLILICGMAKGADSAAYIWADCIFIDIEQYPADWDKYGKSAGFIRNKQMLDEGKPDLVVAFPGGRGTQMMVSLARKAEVEIVEFVFNT